MNFTEKFNVKSLIFHTVILFGTIITFSGCQKFLDAKPNQKSLIIGSLQDCQALLNNYNVMNTGYPSDGEAASDNYYLTPSSWAALGSEDRDTYVWAAYGERLMPQWANPYKVVYNANLVLQTEKDLPAGTDPLSRNQVRGEAMFFRAYAFYQLAQIFAAPYQMGTTNAVPGIALRLSPDLDVKTTRATVQQTYEHILSDLHSAASLLPLSASVSSKPSKVAAFAALARTYLSMENYNQAGIYADSCLMYYSDLIDYNSVSKSSNTPFPIFNKEVIFQSATTIGNTLGTSIAKVDPALMAEYNAHDLRLSVFFRPNAADASFTFKGNYNGNFSSVLFNGLATDEILLIRAECYARAGNTLAAMDDLNTLMKKRWDNTFVPFIANNADNALSMILNERRKELLFRNLRWTDLRRLNRDNRFKKVLSRGTINGTLYTLAPNDLRYTLLIPQDIINKTGIQQNPR